MIILFTIERPLAGSCFFRLFRTIVHIITRYNPLWWSFWLAWSVRGLSKKRKRKRKRLVENYIL